MKPSLAAMEAAASLPISFNEALVDMGHSALLGAALMLITVWASYQTVAPAASTAVVPGEEPDSPAELVLSSANVMFICFGMTAVMQLVNNNLARAFTIGAAIALIRFKIKMNSKAVNMGLFYGSVVGMACGVDQAVLGYVAVAFFGVMQLTVLITAKGVEKATSKRTAVTRSQLITQQASMPIIASTMARPLPVTTQATQAPISSTQDI
jgi:hypothetical protein